MVRMISFQLNIFINKWQIADFWKKNNYDFVVFFSFKSPPFCHLLIKMFDSSSDRSHEYTEQ